MEVTASLTDRSSLDMSSIISDTAADTHKVFVSGFVLLKKSK